MRRKCWVVVGVLILLCILNPLPCAATVLLVPSQFDPIEDAIGVADPGDTVRVTDSRTYDAFTLNKTLLIEGTNPIPATVAGSILCETQGTLRSLTLKNTAASGSIGVIRFTPGNSDDTLRVEGCQFIGRTGQIASAGISLDTGPVVIKDCVMDSLLYVSRGLTYQAGDGVLRIENSLIKTREGMGIGAGLNELIGSTMVCAYDTAGTQAAFEVGGGINCKVVESIVDGFDTVFSGCPSESVAYNIFNGYTTFGCGSVDPDSNMIGVDPLFCEEHETPVGMYTFRIDTPAVAANNSFGVDIGKQLGVECAWGTLARDAIVGEGTVYVLEDVAIPSGKTLTINEGASVRFDEDDAASGTGQSSTKNELLVSGTLEVNGSSGNPVYFRSANASAAEGDWYGIYVQSGGSVDIDYANIRHATYGLRVNSNESSTVTNSTFILNQTYDILAGAGGGSSLPLEISGNQIWVGGGTGIQCESVVEGLDIEGNDIIGNSSSTAGINMGTYTNGYAVNVSGNNVTDFSNGAGVSESAPAGLTLLQNEITDCKWGVKITNGSPAIGDTSSSSDNILSGNTSGIYAEGASATPVLRNNQITGNTYGVQAKTSALPDLGTGSSVQGLRGGRGAWTARGRTQRDPRRRGR